MWPSVTRRIYCTVETPPFSHQRSTGAPPSGLYRLTNHGQSSGWQWGSGDGGITAPPLQGMARRLSERLMHQETIAYPVSPTKHKGGIAARSTTCSRPSVPRNCPPPQNHAASRVIVLGLCQGHGQRPSRSAKALCTLHLWRSQTQEGSGTLLLQSDRVGVTPATSVEEPCGDSLSS
jgi:hypothetical protein